MKVAGVFFAAAFCLQWMFSVPIPVPTVSTTPIAEPCQGYEHYNLIESDLPFSYVECKNMFLQPGKELRINVPLDNIESIMFKNSILPAIPDGAFASFTNLAELYLNRNGLKTIVPGVFDGLTQLQVLHLQDNTLMTIPKGTLNSLTNLEVLDASRNSIISLEEGCFTGLVNLRLLTLKRNNLHFVDFDTFISLSALEMLDLSHNYLFMSELNFTFTFKTPYLKSLLINNNLLQHLSVSSVKNLTSLELLDVSFNALKEIDFGSIVAPKFANFSNNQISVLKGWSDLNLSHAIDLTKNKINSALPIMGNTKKLYLGKNEMTTLDAFMFANSGELVELDLSFNFIRTIVKDSFHGLIDLEILYLNNNKIIYLPLGCFNNLNSLKILSLSHNFLGQLDDGTFRGLSKLTTLLLNNNKLSTINNNDFRGLTNLQNLCLNHNLLTTINMVPLLKDLPNLNTISLNENHWDCGKFSNISEALTDTVRFFEISCDKLNLRVTAYKKQNVGLYRILRTMCACVLLLSVILLDVVVLRWYFFQFKVNLIESESKIRKLKLAIARLEAKGC